MSSTTYKTNNNCKQTLKDIQNYKNYFLFHLSLFHIIIAITITTENYSDFTQLTHLQSVSHALGCLFFSFCFVFS